MKKTCEHSGVEIDESEGCPDTNFISSDEVKELVELRKKHAALLEANKGLIDALEFYAYDKHRKFSLYQYIDYISFDFGKIAAQALAKYGAAK